MVPSSFENCADGVNYFCELLNERGMTVEKKEKIVAYAGHGKYLNQDLIFTKTGEMFYIVCRPRGRWYPKATENVSELGRPLDARLKYIIKIFGNEDGSISGLNEDSLLNLLEKADIGIKAYLVTIFPQSGEILWCSAQDAYDMVMRYGVLPQLSMIGMEGQTMCSIPTGWMKKWVNPIQAYPEVDKI